ncbi:hypothetical protein DQW77_15760 [Roseovarius sp. TE539]|uniref:hypothetical protein n=1 Tax=Roseovarius sp. TE539 TaxID=2249812 RepID=UPI000DDC9F96|nr:hypothetical protein [Roseovarius sp. TE539]RBI69066.1 hypothetical protein DQW77_15760 [Roseovarius sp. TE539]
MNAPRGTSSNEAPPRTRRISVSPEDLTDNEVAWVEFLRMISDGRDLHPTLRRVQLLRRVCGKF